MSFPTGTILKDNSLFFQYPVITEESFYKQNKDDEKFIGFPWATVIDKNLNHTEIYRMISPHINSREKYYTCCQHIHFRKLIQLFKRLNIFMVYSVHKIKGENEIDEVVIRPCPLYAANYEDETRNLIFRNIDYINYERKYLYTFQGSYANFYLTDIRNKIFKFMNHPSNTYVLQIQDWHYNKLVYDDKQNFNKELNEDEKHKKDTNDYNHLLLNSRFSLCPSGSGPNSIRLWESLAIGSIPILLADTLELPIHNLWKDAIIECPEKDYNKIPEILSKISPEREKEMRENCIKIYNFFRNNFKNDNSEFPKEIIHYCIGSYDIGDYGGVARYDYNIKTIFPRRKFIKGPENKNELIEYIKTCKNPLVITDNQFAIDIPNYCNTIIVHHGSARTHAEREPTWEKSIRDLCCDGQDKMLTYRLPLTTKIISCSQFCTEEFSRHYPRNYSKFENKKILHSSELDENLYKKHWNQLPVVLGNWSTENKGSKVIEILKNYPWIYFQKLEVNPINGEIELFNKRKQDIYLQSDIFLQISLCEGNSYATLDALMCGLVVVASNVGLFYKDVPEDCFVKIDWNRNNDIEYILDKIQYAWVHKEEISQKARKWYMENLRLEDWKEQTKSYIS
jgi:hypothetical protein